MTKERYERFKTLVDSLNDCYQKLYVLAFDETLDNGELSDISDGLCADLDLIVSELRQRLEFIEV